MASRDNGHPPYDFAIVPLKYLMVDVYQRPLTSFVEKIEHDYNPALIGTLCVSERSKTKYALIDGQTRAEGMKRVGEDRAPCIVYQGLTLEQEAELFAKFQTERRGMTSASRFRAEVIAGHETAVAIDKIVTEHGFLVDHNSTEPGALRAVAALEYLYRGTLDRRTKGGKHTDPELLADTLDILRQAWPKLPDTAKSAVMIRGLGWYLARNPDGKPRTSEIDTERLVARLSKVTPSDLAKRAEALREGRGMSGNSPAYMAEAIEAQYRKR
jgi:hypothetical protein